MVTEPGRARAEARWAAGLLVVGAIAYLGVPLELVVGGAVDRSTSYLSENAALDQPYSAIFRAADAAAGVAVLFACIVIGRRGGRTGLSGRLAASVTALSVFALGTIADSVFVLRCAPSMSEACRVADAERSLGLAHQVHVLTSVTALAGATLAAALLWSAVRRGRMAVSPRLRRTVAVVAGSVVVVAVVVTLAAVVDQLFGGLPAGAGYVQRAQTVAISVSLSTVAVGVVRGWFFPIRHTERSPR